jgi:hypothetical protein
MKTTEEILNEFDGKFFRDNFGEWMIKGWGAQVGVEDFKEFIRNALVSQRKEFKEMIEASRILSIAKYGNMPAPYDPTYKEGWNSALDDLKSKLKGNL